MIIADYIIIGEHRTGDEIRYARFAIGEYFLYLF